MNDHIITSADVTAVHLYEDYVGSDWGCKAVPLSRSISPHAEAIRLMLTSISKAFIWSTANTVRCHV